MIPSQCVILTGGMGTRLGELTRELPKPLLPVAGKPFLETLVLEAKRRGFTDILLLAGYKGAAVESFAGALQAKFSDDCRLNASIEPEPLGTGGALLHAADLLAEQFLLLNGDTWFDFNWLELLGVAGNGSALAARKIPNSGRHETLTLAPDGTVMQITSRTGSSAEALVNGGVYVLKKSDFVGFPRHFSIENDLLPELIGRSALRGREFDGFFLDIGIPETFEAAQRLVPAQRLRPAVFFDRDGVLNHDDNYVGSPERLRWVEGAREAVRLANNLGCYVFVITNQAGVARGFYEEADVQSLHHWMAEELRQSGASIDDWRYCPFHPEGSVERYRSVHTWRKPEPGMILDLLESWPVDRQRSILIGDQESDCIAGRAAGIQAHLFTGGNLYPFVAERLRSALQS